LGVDESMYDMFVSVKYGTELENWIPWTYQCIKLCSWGYVRSKPR
jgi:hypothetical protein